MTLTAVTPIVANDEVHVLAESPVWDPIRERLLWVDIARGLVLSGDLAGDGTIDIVSRFAVAGTAGTVAPAKSGAWVVANGDDLLEVQGAAITRTIRVLRSEGARRFNDGKPDAAGRFLVGTRSLTGPSETEELLVVERDGSHRVIDDDLTLSNGLGWSADGRQLYTVDSMRHRVYARSYDVVSGATGERRVFVELADGYPDGLCVDVEDHVWVAVWGLGQVRRYSPAGELVAAIEVPAPHTSSVAFAGPLLDTLVITTASDELTPQELEAHPLSGRLFTVVPGVTGLPQPLWDGFADSQDKETA